jgi:hypothetical protein
VLVSKLLKMKLKLILALLALLLVGVVAYDLASRGSRLQRWFAGDSKVVNAAKRKTAATQSGEALAVAENRERLLAEARRIWANVPKVSYEAVDQIRSDFEHETEPNKRFAMLHFVGVTISRAAFDRRVARHEAERGKGVSGMQLWADLLEDWCLESPREAVALAYVGAQVSVKDDFPAAVDMFLAMAMPALRRDSAAWAAFLEVSPDPRIAAHAELWMREEVDPGVMWSQGTAADVSVEEIRSHVSRMLRRETPARALQAVLRCPDAAFKSRSIAGLASRLSPEQLQELAGGDFSGDAATANFLRAIAGDPNASFPEAISRNYDFQVAEWAKENAALIYAQWLKVDAKVAMNEISDPNNREYLEQFMVEAMRDGSLDEIAIMALLAAAEPARRDDALAAFYRAQSANDPLATMQRIMISTHIEDQINAAKPVLRDWAAKSPREAAAWLASLPEGEDRLELAAAIASEWAMTQPQAAIAYAQQQGLGLEHQFAASLAFAIKDGSEASIRSMLESYRDAPEYNRLIVLLAGYRLGRNPLAAYEFMAEHARGDWQPVVVEQTIRMLEWDDTRADHYAQTLPSLDLSKVAPARLAAAAQLLMGLMSEQGQVNQGFNWTLRLPANAAEQVRVELIARLDLSKAGRSALLTNWIQTAEISAKERAALLQTLTQRSQAPSGAK